MEMPTEKTAILPNHQLDVRSIASLIHINDDGTSI